MSPPSSNKYPVVYPAVISGPVSTDYVFSYYCLQ